MAISRKSLEILLDLVEIKLSSLEVYDRDDRKVFRGLEQCRTEIDKLLGASRFKSVPDAENRDVA